jgi:hypothetical protein
MNLARLRHAAFRAARFLQTNTGVFRVVGLVGIVFSIVAIALGNNLEAVALAIIGCEFFISSVLIDRFNQAVAAFGGGGGGLRFHPVVVHHVAASASDDDEAGDDEDEDSDEESEDDESDEHEAPTPAKEKPDFAVN